MTALVALKPQLKKSAEQMGVKFSYMPVILKAASMALSHYPILNANVDDGCQNLTYKVI